MTQLQICTILGNQQALSSLIGDCRGKFHFSLFSLDVPRLSASLSVYLSEIVEILEPRGRCSGHPYLFPIFFIDVLNVSSFLPLSCLLSCRTTGPPPPLQVLASFSLSLTLFRVFNAETRKKMKEDLRIGVHGTRRGGGCK